MDGRTSLLSMSNHHKAYVTRQGKTYRKYGIKQSANKLKYKTRMIKVSKQRFNY